MTDKLNLSDDLDDLKTKVSFPESISNTKFGCFPIAVDQRFEYIRDLGAGSGGRVCLAYDQKLQRKVALKFLLAENKVSTQVLLQEARAQAQVIHENICQIYEVIESNTHIFLVMQYIDGEPLNKLSSQLNLEQKLLIIEKILRGLHQAHIQGLMHRDLKPSNILVEVSEHGEFKPYLIDFGLAHRDRHGSQLSDCAGLGTPHYMAPEQSLLNANQIDRRADIYSIGATLFHLIYNQLPKRIEKSDDYQFEKIEDYATSPLCDFTRNIPADLQTMILKCLSVNPNKRYPSARVLAEEIVFYRNGDPIKAHQGRIYRLRKIIRKHRMLVFLFSVIFLTICTSGGWFIYQSYQQKIREQMIQEFSAKVENMEARVRFSHMAPLHDISPEIMKWNQEINELESDILELGELAIGPGNYAIGRMHYSLQGYDDAMEHLLAAWNAGFQQPRVAYVLALTYGAIYQRQKHIINNLPGKTNRENKLKALEEKFRKPAIRFLEQGMEASAYKSLAQATMLFYQGNLNNALELIKDTNEFPSWFYQHKVLTGDIYQAMLDVSRESHKNEEIEHYSNLALKSYEEAINIAPSDFQLQLKPLNLYMTRLENFLYGKMGDFNEEYEKALRHLTLAKANQPSNYQVYFSHGQLLSRKSEYENQFSGDPLSTFEQAVNQLEMATQLAPQQSSTWLALALAYTNKLALLQNKGFTLGNEFKNAMVAFEKIDIVERDYFFYNAYGSLLRSWALSFGDENYNESNEYFELAINAYESASVLQPNAIGARINAGSIFRLWSNILSPSEARVKLNSAINKYNEALNLNDAHFVANYYLGVSYRKLAKIENHLFEDNSHSIESSKKYLEIALQQSSGHPFVVNEIAILKSDQAVYSWQKGLDYQFFIEDGIEKLDLSLQENPENHTLNSTRASIYILADQLMYFTESLDQGDIGLTQYAIDQALKYSDYNKIDNLLLRLLYSETVKRQQIDDVAEDDDRSFLLYAEWLSQNKNFEDAEVYFQKIKQLYPSLLWRYRLRHLMRWQQQVELRNSKKQITQKIEKLRNKITNHYPALLKNN